MLNICTEHKSCVACRNETVKGTLPLRICTNQTDTLALMVLPSCLRGHVSYLIYVVLQSHYVLPEVQWLDSTPAKYRDALEI